MEGLGVVGTLPMRRLGGWWSVGGELGGGLGGWRVCMPGIRSLLHSTELAGRASEGSWAWRRRRNPVPAMMGGREQRQGRTE